MATGAISCISAVMMATVKQTNSKSFISSAIFSQTGYFSCKMAIMLVKFRLQVRLVQVVPFGNKQAYLHLSWVFITS